MNRGNKVETPSRDPNSSSVVKKMNAFTLFSIGKKEKMSGKSVLVANSSSSSEDASDVDGEEDFNFRKKLNFSSALNASEEIGDSSVDKSNREKPILEISDQSILEASDQLVVDESLEVVDEIDVMKKPKSLGDSKSVTFLDDDNDVERDVTSLMKAAGKLQISSPDKNDLTRNLVGKKFNLSTSFNVSGETDDSINKIADSTQAKVNKKLNFSSPFNSSGVVGDLNVTRSKNGRRKSMLGKNVVYLVSSESDIDSDQDEGKDKKSSKSRKPTNRDSSSDSDSDVFAKFSARKKQQNKKPKKKKQISSDSEDEESEIVSESEHNDDSDLNNVSISLDTIKKKYGSVRKPPRRRQESEKSDIDEDEDESRNEYDLEDSFLVGEEEGDEEEEEGEDIEGSSDDESEEFIDSDDLSSDPESEDVEEEDDDGKIKIRESDFEDSWIVPDGVEIPAEDSDSDVESPPKPAKPRRTAKPDSEDESSPVETPEVSDKSDSDSESPFRPAKPKRTLEKPKPVSRRIEQIQPEPKKFVPKTFLASLSSDITSPTLHPEAYKYLKNFSKTKQELAERLFALYNREVFSDGLPADTELFWSARLVKTAGRCHSKMNPVTKEPYSRIELSTKVLDSSDRLRDTLIHEMCHAAVYIISKTVGGGHGPIWKSWGHKAMRRFPELPCIARCHSYKIRTRYVFECEGCGQQVGRHSKSLDTVKKCCARCRGKFHLLVVSKQNGKYERQDNLLKTPKAPNAFALYVKDNYKHCRTPGSSHKDAMALLSKQFAASKI